MKVVINAAYGGFGLSELARERSRELGLPRPCEVPLGHVEQYRSDPRLVQIVEELGVKKARSSGANLKIVDVPDDVKWFIAEYDGMEWVAEEHRTWS